MMKNAKKIIVSGLLVLTLLNFATAKSKSEKKYIRI